MKYLILALLIPLTSYASEIEFNVKSLTDTTGSNHFSLKTWSGVEVKYHPNKEGVYYFGSHETAKVNFESPVFDIKFTGIGLGIKKNIAKGIKVYGQLGYYFSDTSVKGRFKCTQKNDCNVWEGLYYGLNSRWADLHGGRNVMFNEYEINSTNAIGITVGAELLHPLSDNWDFNIGIEWRAMEYMLMVHGMSPEFGDYDKDGQRLETTYTGHGSTNYKIGFNYKF